MLLARDLELSAQCPAVQGINVGSGAFTPVERVRPMALEAVIATTIARANADRVRLYGPLAGCIRSPIAGLLDVRLPRERRRANPNRCFSVRVVAFGYALIRWLRSPARRGRPLQHS
jgi:uncharacterized protein with von Willebrand factor type A (vWA) domain